MDAPTAFDTLPPATRGEAAASHLPSSPQALAAPSFSTLTFSTMGTVVSLLTTEELPEELAQRVRAEFSRRDEIFSLYQPHSIASRFAAGDLPLPQTGGEFLDAYRQAQYWAQATSGGFNPITPEGTVDLSGIVKALAIAGGGQVLQVAGWDNWCLNAGGDILVSGYDPSINGPWIAGIVDPQDRRSLISQAELGHYFAPELNLSSGNLGRLYPQGAKLALATSGTAERGEHVWRLENTDSDLQQVSVLARDIITADILATAILSAGPECIVDFAARFEVEVLAFDYRGQAWATPAFRA